MICLGKILGATFTSEVWKKTRTLGLGLETLPDGGASVHLGLPDGGASVHLGLVGLSMASVRVRVIIQPKRFHFWINFKGQIYFLNPILNSILK